CGAIPRQQVIKLVSTSKGEMRGITERLARQRQLGHVRCGETFNGGSCCQNGKASQDFQSPVRALRVTLAGFFKDHRRNIHTEQRQSVLPPRPCNLLVCQDDDVTDWACCVIAGNCGLKIQCGFHEIAPKSGSLTPAYP